MKTKNKLSIIVFYLINLLLIIFYLYPGNLFECFLYDNCYLGTQITKNFTVSSNYSISSNHFYSFTILSAIGIYAYRNTKKIKFLIIYLFLLSVFLESLHLIIPKRQFDWSDLFGNILGLIFVIFINKVKNKYDSN